MKKIIMLILILTIVMTSLFAASDYEEGYLDGYKACQNGKDNIYSSNKSVKSHDFGVWNIHYYLDNFGDVTDDGYLFIKANYGTIGFKIEKDTVEFQIFPNNPKFQLYKYYISRTDWKIYIKCENSRYEFDLDYSSFNLFLDNNSYQDFIELLMKEKPITVNIVPKGYSQNYLQREIETTGFNNAYKELIN